MITSIKCNQEDYVASTTITVEILFSSIKGLDTDIEAIEKIFDAMKERVVYNAKLVKKAETVKAGKRLANRLLGS